MKKFFQKFVKKDDSGKASVSFWAGILLAIIGLGLIVSSFFLIQDRFFASPKVESFFSDTSTLGFWKTTDPALFTEVSKIFLSEELVKKLVPISGQERAILWFENVETMAPLFFFEKEKSLLSKKKKN